jgi:hypothetical protein
MECLLSALVGVFLHIFRVYNLCGEEVSYIGFLARKTAMRCVFRITYVHIHDSKNSEGAWKFISSVITRDFAVNCFRRP